MDMFVCVFCLYYNTIKISQVDCFPLYFLYFRYEPKNALLGETNGLAIADQWEGPYRLVTAAATPGLNSEDPFLFLNARGP